MNDGVLDSTVVLALLTPDDGSDWADKLVRELLDVYVLDITPYEVYNALIKKFRLGELSESELDRAKEMADSLIYKTFQVREFKEIKARAFQIARRVNISVYDAAYLALAERLRVYFYTLDHKLREKLSGTKYYKITMVPEESV